MPRNRRRSISKVDDDPVEEGGDNCWEFGGEEGEDDEELCVDGEFMALNGGIENGNGGAAGGINKFLFESIEDFMAASAGNAEG